MSILGEMLGIAALVPAMAGSIALPDDGGPSQLVLAMCRGGALAIPMDRDERPAMPATICCAKGCRRRDKRNPLDPEQ
ncbi:hypothetical protein [Aurantiacibacter odishensis]|uniref:hypothetical protein n=1 Tax=Aurantiacibacter odishensis TaxID=1155476 RepID=UPI000E714EB6|nr:hypothetical protein [Aurantiacibacter odishensis]